MKRPSSKGGRKHLDDDEQSLWSHAAESIEPLKRRKSRFHPALEALADEEAAALKRAKPPPSSPSAAPASKKSAAIVPTPAPRAAKPPPPIAGFDRKKVRKIRSGHVEIEARVDLHGMRQDEAHMALVGFLRRCQNKGQRWVLVITGKGKAADRDDDRPFDMTVSRDRGVLRRNVPRWLEEPDLRALVVSYTEAAIQHGGAGALYVHLRKKN